MRCWQVWRYCSLCYSLLGQAWTPLGQSSKKWCEWFSLCVSVILKNKTPLVNVGKSVKWAC
ncbi:hypothetical protein [Moraxella lacunata]|uniref:hypothetical protein n=1 Tax=Moraxella lacunata TaxID=477 RepID=UPI003EE24132